MFVEKYLEGTNYYRSKEWEKLIDTMEKALQEYLLAEELCRVNCDKPFDMGWLVNIVKYILLGPHRQVP